MVDTFVPRGKESKIGNKIPGPSRRLSRSTFTGTVTILFGVTEGMVGGVLVCSEKSGSGPGVGVKDCSVRAAAVYINEAVSCCDEVEGFSNSVQAVK